MKAKAYATLTIILVLFITLGLALGCNYGAGENCDKDPDICPCDQPHAPNCDPMHTDADERGCWGTSGTATDCSQHVTSAACEVVSMCKWCEGDSAPYSCFPNEYMCSGNSGDSGYKCCESTQGQDACRVDLDQACPPMYEDLPNEWVDTNAPANCIHPGPGMTNPPWCDTSGGSSTSSSNDCGDNYCDRYNGEDCNSCIPDCGCPASDFCTSSGECIPDTSGGDGSDQDSGYVCCQPTQGGDACRVDIGGVCPDGYTHLENEWVDQYNPSNCDYPGPGAPNPPFCPADGSTTGSGDDIPPRPPSYDDCGNCHWECMFEDNRPDYECDSQCRSLCDTGTTSGTGTTYEPGPSDQCQQCIDKCINEMGRTHTQCKEGFCEYDCGGADQPTPTPYTSTTTTYSGDQCETCKYKCRTEMGRTTSQCEEWCEYDCGGEDTSTTDGFDTSTPCGQCEYQCEVVERKPVYECDRICAPKCPDSPFFDNECDKCFYKCVEVEGNSEYRCKDQCRPACEEGMEQPSGNECDNCMYKCVEVEGNLEYRCKDRCQPVCGSIPEQRDDCGICTHECEVVEGRSSYECKSLCRDVCDRPIDDAIQVDSIPTTIRMYKPMDICRGKLSLDDVDMTRDEAFFTAVRPDGVKEGFNIKFEELNYSPFFIHFGTFAVHADESSILERDAANINIHKNPECRPFPPPDNFGGPDDGMPEKPPLYDRCGTCKWTCEFEQNRPEYECREECGPLCGETEEPWGTGEFDEFDLPEPPAYAFRDRPMEGSFVGRPILLKLNEPVDVCGMQFEALAIRPEERVLRIKAVWPDGKTEEVRINIDEALEGTLHGFVKHFDTVSLHVPEPEDGEDKPPIARKWAVLAALIRMDCEPFSLSDLMGGPGGEEPTEGPGGDDAIVADIEIQDDGRFITKLERGQWTLVCNRRVRYMDLKDADRVAVVEADTGIRMRELLFKADTFHEEDGREVTDEQRVGLNKVQALKDGFHDGDVLVIIVRPDLRCSEDLKQQTSEQPMPGDGPEIPSRMICCQPEDASVGSACMVPMQGKCPRGYTTLENEWIDPDSNNNCISEKGIRRPFCRVSPPGEEEVRCGDGECQENESQETCCKDCGCPDDMSCRDDACVARAPDNSRQCATFCGRVTEPEVCSFACMSCPDCTDKAPPWPCLTNCIKAETGIGMSDLCDKRCSRSKDPETCNVVCGSCHKCLFMKDANKCLTNCAKNKLKTFTKRCDDICEPFGEKDVCNPICRDCRKCVVDPDDICAEECVNERRGTMKEACEEACSDGGPECVDKCLECRKCAPKIGKNGLKVCLRSCLDSQGMKKKMLDMLKKVQAEDGDMARKLLVASALDSKKKERFHKAIADSHNSINNQRVEDAKKALDDLEKQLAELKDLEMKVRVLEKKVTTVRKKVERKDLAKHVSKFVKNRAVDEGDNVTDDTADEMANDTVEVGEEEINITLEAEVLEVEEGDTTENVSVFTISVKNLKDKNLTGVTIIQSIPKEIAESASELVFAGAVTIIEDDPIVGWDLSMLEEEEEKKLSFSTKKKVDLDAVADTETAAVKVAVEEVEVATIEQEMASEEGAGSTEETKQAMVERIEASETAGSDQPTDAVAPVEGAHADKPGAATQELPFGLSSKDLRGLLLVLMAVVVLVAMVKTGMTTGGTSSVSTVEHDRLEEAFGHGEVISVEEDADEVVTKVKSPVKVEKTKPKKTKGKEKTDTKETEGEEEDKDSEEEEEDEGEK